MFTPFRFLIFLAGTALISLSLLAGAAMVMAGNYAQPTSEDQAIVYTPIVPEMNTPKPARSYIDVPYCGTSDRHQALDIFMPSYQPNQFAPAIIYVHGGGWTVSDKQNGFLDYYKGEMLARGMAVVSVNHRLTPEYTYPSQNQDIACALDYLYRYAAKYGIDRQRFGLFGESSGAQLITATALDQANNKAPWKKSLRAVIPYYGISDFQLLLNDPNYHGWARRYLAPNPQAVAKQASVTYHPLSNPPDFYIYHGDHDNVIPYSQSVLLHNYLLEQGGWSQLVLVKNGNHGFTMSSTPNVEQLRGLMLSNFQRAFRHSLLD